MHETQSVEWKLSLFGALSVSDPEGRVIHISRAKVSELLAFLALRRTSVVDRDAIVQALWPDVESEIGRGRLRQTLSLLRQEVPGVPIIVHGKNALELDRSQVTVETETIESRIKWLQALGVRQRNDASRQAWEVVAKGLLPELDADWLVGERVRFERLAARLLGEFKDEDTGQRANFRLGDDFGGLSIPMVGRVQELAALDKWLGQSNDRYLIITGPPGVGKTRLLKEAVHRAQSLCDATITLSTVQASEAPWLERIGQMVGLQGRDQIAEGIRRLLRSFHRPLIALDDIDQVDEVTQEWLDQLCRSIPHLKVLGTARRTVTLGSSEPMRLQPLRTTGEGGTDARALLSRFALHFGVEERHLVKQQETLAQIASLLEGLPLSLEVAAGWLSYVQPERLLQQLCDSSALVIGRAGHGRNTLKECIAVLCKALPDKERFALACLSVCRGGCGEELAEEMLGPEWLWHLRSLNDRSLLFKVQGYRGHRFVVLQAIRESVEAAESACELHAAIERHRAACFRLCDRAIWEINEGDRAGWLDWLRDDGDNLLATCSRVLDDDGQARTVVLKLQRLRAAYWIIRRPGEFKKVFDEACAKVAGCCDAFGVDTPSIVVERNFIRLFTEGRVDEALDAAASHTRSLVDAGAARFDIADAYDIEGELRSKAQDLHGAFECFVSAGKQFLAAGFPRHSLWMEAKIGGIERRLHGPEGGEQRRWRALHRADELGDFNSVGMYCKRFAKDAMAAGRWTDAQSLAGRSVEAFARVGEPANVFASYVVLAAAQLGAGLRSEASSTLDHAAEFAPLSDDQSLPEYDELWEALKGQLSVHAKPSA